MKVQARSRKHLPHEIPLWIDPGKEIYFLTICGKPRGENQLAHCDIADQVFESFIHRNKAGVWFVHFGLLMPDHVHVLVSFPHSGKRIQTIVSKWKEWTTKDLGIQWHNQSYLEKADYIRANPVRACLVRRIEDWPYVFIGDRDGMSG
ncbi:MAG TPA: hypothetical protein VFA51_14730 [Candidatus Udaeobacter sp.]|nr:hypothetical protein [Candidatus Udaeobacter sp.]